jgi:hypothetical protein
MTIKELQNALFDRDVMLGDRRLQQINLAKAAAFDFYFLVIELVA